MTGSPAATAASFSSSLASGPSSGPTTRTRCSAAPGAKVTPSGAPRCASHLAARSGGSGSHETLTARAASSLSSASLGRSLEQQDHGVGEGRSRQASRVAARLRLPLPGLDVADEDHPPVRHHRRGVAQRVDRLGVEGGGRALVEVEVAEGGVERAIENRPRDLVLQEVLGAVEVVRRGEIAPLDRAADRIERLCRHAGS